MFHREDNTRWDENWGCSILEYAMRTISLKSMKAFVGVLPCFQKMSLSPVCLAWPVDAPASKTQKSRANRGKIFWSWAPGDVIMTTLTTWEQHREAHEERGVALFNSLFIKTGSGASLVDTTVFTALQMKDATLCYHSTGKASISQMRTGKGPFVTRIN